MARNFINIDLQHVTLRANNRYDHCASNGIVSHESIRKMLLSIFWISFSISVSISISVRFVVTLSHCHMLHVTPYQFVSLSACQLSHTNAQTPNQTATMFRTYQLYKYNHVRVCIRCCVFVCLLGELS